MKKTMTIVLDLPDEASDWTLWSKVRELPDTLSLDRQSSRRIAAVLTVTEEVEGGAQAPMTTLR